MRSPNKITWIFPNSLEFWWSLLKIDETKPSSWESTIEHSSMISTLTFHSSFALSGSPEKMEELYVVPLVNSDRMECIVPPEMLLAAIPVGARRSGFCPEWIHQSFKAFKRYDFPVPPGPVTKKCVPV